MVKKIKKTDNEEQIKKELAQAKAALENLKNQKPKKSAKTTKPKVKQNSKAVKPKQLTKAEKEKQKKAAKAEKEKQKKAAKAEKDKQKKAAKAEKEKAEEEQKTEEEKWEEQFSDEQIRNFQIEKMDMDRITNRVCEIATFEDKGMLQTDLLKKLKLSGRDCSRLALRLERRGLISREKILQKGRWTYKLIIEQTPISLESLQNSPCLTCPVEQKCDVTNVHPEPSPLYCQLLEDWVITEFSKKKK